MKVSACIVTRGDVDLAPVLDSLPDSWERVIYDNSGSVSVMTPGTGAVHHQEGGGYEVVDGPGWRYYENVPDLAVYGRYEAAFEYATHNLVYVQDDDCVLDRSSFGMLMQAWRSHERVKQDALVANMPEKFRHDFYEHHCLVGFGAMFDRRRAQEAFALWAGSGLTFSNAGEEMGWFTRVCDVVFTTLTPRVLVDAPYEDLVWANAANRMWKQRTHVGERKRALDLALRIAA